MQPVLFTLVLRHPDTVDAIVTPVYITDVAGIALGASPVQEVFIVPAQQRHATERAAHIIATAPSLSTATACDGGFTVSAPSLPWQDDIFRALDCTARQLRAQKRKAKAAQDLALKADLAKERARAVVLDHSRDKALFELEQRARLVTV